MCGIFGYIGDKNAAEITYNGLKMLEYRGYDSWGIAAVSRQKSKIKNQKSKLIIEKSIGKIANAKLNSEFLNLNSGLAIGHTRWATHGEVTKTNAHPHLDCAKKIAVVHNGIVENFEDLKKELEKKGHKFLSQTDSEIIPHLIEEEMKNKSFEDGFRAAFSKLEGLNAVVAVLTGAGEILAAKTGSPLVIGRGENEYYLASDASGILEHTKKLLFLTDNQMLILGKTLKLLSLPDGKELNIEFETADWEVKFEEKGDFPHFMIKEISQQPTVIRTLAKDTGSNIKNLAKTIEKAQGTFFIGAGTAYHAGLVGTYFFSKIAGKHVNMAVASEFNYLLDFIHQKSLVVALSQSGETIDVIEPLNIAKKKGATIASLVNTPGSTIYRLSDLKLLLNAGVEKAVASTKDYTAKISVLLILSQLLSKQQIDISRQLLLAADEIERLIKNKEQIMPIAEFLTKSQDIYLIGRGVSYPTSLEAALKIKEVSYIHAEGLAGGELKHGTLALISKGTPCIVFAPSDETYHAVISNAIEIKSRGGVIIGIGSRKDPVFDYFIEVRDCLDANPIAQIVPAQLLAYFIAVKKGLDPDKPRNLAKSVTVK